MKKPAAKVHSIIFTSEDMKIINELVRKKGGSIPSVVREGLRVLATKEQLAQ